MSGSVDVVETLRTTLAETGDVVATASEVAERSEYGKRAVLERLRQAEASGTVTKKRAGANAIVWWPADLQVDLEDRRDTARTQPAVSTPEPVSTEADVAVETRGERVEEAPPESTTDVEEEIDVDVDALAAEFRDYLEDRAPQSQHTKDAMVDAFRLLRNRGVLRTKELKGALYPRYEEHYEDEISLWNSLDRHLKSCEVFEKPGYGEWGYAGDDVLRELLDEEDLSDFL